MKNLKSKNEKNASTKPTSKKEVVPSSKKPNNHSNVAIKKSEKPEEKGKVLLSAAKTDILTDLHVQFLIEIQRENYENALVISEKILQSEPNNKTISEFNNLLKDKANTDLPNNEKISSDGESSKEDDSIKYDDEDCYNYDDDDSMKSD